MWEIFAYHNSEALAGIFNAIAAIMASGTYLSAVAAVAFCGFVAAMVAYMFQPEKLQGWKWIGSVVLIYGVLFVPRVTVAVVDKTGGTPNRIIANVPFGMAALGGLTSSIGNSITELFETAFQTLPGPGALPPELAYQQNGLMFGSRLIQELRRTSLPDPGVRTDLINFVNNCTAFDIADGTISPTAFSESSDLWSMMAFTNPARFSTITSAAGVTTNTCDAVYASIGARIPAQVNTLTQRLSSRLNPSLTSLAAQAAFVNQVPQAFIRSQISSAASTAADIIRQNALINAINDAGELGCQKINDPSCMMMATGRASAVASQNAAWINGAKIAEQALPVVRNVAESMCYAVFPLVVLLLFLSSGRTTLMIISGYAIALISIQLWPPLFAILNYMATLYAQIDQAAAAEIGGGVKALSLQTASPIYSNAVSAQAVVSYLIIGIPMLAYSLANRLVNFGSAVMGGLQGLSSSSLSGSASAAAAIGNSNLGNVTMDQRNVTPTSSNPYVTREQDDFANWKTHDNHGRTAISLLKNEGITAQVVTARVTQDDVEAASKTASAAKGEVISAGTTQAASLREGMDKVRQRVNAARSNAGQGLAGYEEVGRSFDQFWSEANRISKATGVDAGQVADTMLRFSMMPEAFGMGGGVAVGKRYNVSVSDTDSKVLDHANQDTGKVSKSFGDKLTHDRSFLNTLSSEGKAGSSLASDLSTAGQRSDVAERRYAEAVSRLQEVRQAYQLGYGYSRDLAADPVNSSAVLESERVAAQFRGSPQALAAHMASHLGNFSTNPARPTTGAGLPSGFSDVQETFLRQSKDSEVNPDLYSLKAANDGKIRSQRLGEPGAPPSPSSPGLAPMPGSPGPLPGADGRTPQQFRDHVTERGDAHHKNNDDWIGGFEKRQHLKRDSNGHLIVDYSLVGRSGAMFGADVYDTAAQAEAAVRKATTTKAPDGTSPREQAIKATPEVPNMLPKGRSRPRGN
ncbi:conjugal transfer protein TraG N-terminal domain-containing protein [Piscinibacter defluvii]|uniref:conjugal transfer protein TraG N-terminal domain-containing protein n=1 Tax=Piscinibacter defluvii TaxID=1796922 RepID=UPI000FDDDE91|nr:conjugal transfer protein TraG N-terminal domain-containing protein [Piscinibacter defluvii]